MFYLNFHLDLIAWGLGGFFIGYLIGRVKRGTK